MTDQAYNSVNTTVRVLENELLDRADFESLLQADGLREALVQLKKTRYAFDVDELEESKNFEAVLTNELAAGYQRLFDEVSDQRVINIFALRYTYHNLKVLLKARFTKQNLSHLIIPIGSFKKKSLQNLVQTGQSEHLPAVMVEGVVGAIEDYETYHRVQTADVFMDTYYFKHLRKLSEELNDERFTFLIDTLIDLENMNTLLRSRRQEQSRSFMMTVLSSSGTITKTDLVNESDTGDVADAIKLFEHKEYKDHLASIFSGDTSEYDPVKLELLNDRVLHSFLETAVFEGFGPMPVLAYLFALEMEVKNLRLILVGKNNGFSVDQIRERMHPIYVA
ncbi:V-type ATPase subunit [Atopobacter phocae]|uniref:V-type ATPase subunit n=1 Tax=Atopobacter phocae TaxID=136492 RepID=UPI00046FBC20|nr:V-type ATPase subunit [Atopobacter phocae]